MQSSANKPAVPVAVPGGGAIPSRASRAELYKLVHKGLRSYMSSVLALAGRTDPGDACEVADTLEQVRGLLAICRDHLHHENDIVHPAMEARRPGTSGDTAADHVHHLASIASLAVMADDVDAAGEDGRPEALLALYRALGVFVAENFEHMQVEESHNTAVLWDAYTDEEIGGFEHAIVSSIPPATMQVYLRWMVPAANAVERAEFLAGVRKAMPPEAFEHILAAIQPHLSERDRYKLSTALQTLPLAA